MLHGIGAHTHGWMTCCILIMLLTFTLYSTSCLLNVVCSLNCTSTFTHGLCYVASPAQRERINYPMVVLLLLSISISTHYRCMDCGPPRITL